MDPANRQPTGLSPAHQISYLESQIKEEERAIGIKTNELSQAKDKLHSHIKSSWIGRLVNFLSTSPKLNWLHNTLFQTFQNYKSEVTAQGYLYADMDAIEQSKKTLEGDVKTHQIAIKTLLSNAKAVDFITPLFGSKEEFEKLPVLKLTENMGSGTGYWDRIRQDQMRDDQGEYHPVMRFEDEDGRIGFVVCAAHLNLETSQSGKPVVQIFHQRYSSDASTWTANGENIVYLKHGHFIHNGRLKPQDEAGFNALGEILNKRGAEVTSSLTGNKFYMVLEEYDPRLKNPQASTLEANNGQNEFEYYDFEEDQSVNRDQPNQPVEPPPSKPPESGPKEELPPESRPEEEPPPFTIHDE